MNEQKTERLVTVSEALSDLPKAVSLDNAPMPYPKKRGGKYSDYQKLMRLDWDAPLLSSTRKRAKLSADALHNHHTKGVESRRRKIIAAIQPGASGASLPPELWKGTRSHKWRRLDPDEPSYTILAQMHRDLSEWIHPLHDRWITVREAARLQSFHDGFVFYGSECQQLKQVGNAVPPLLGLAVARAAKGLLAMTG
jgi:DNA (cytosine-5)-methyltransferase 1